MSREIRNRLIRGGQAVLASSLLGLSVGCSGVTVLRHEAVPGGCQALGDVTATPDDPRTNPIDALKRHTQEMGGDTVLVESESPTEAKGQAFNCRMPDQSLGDRKRN
ncbi:MAG: hypothetical protein ABI592_14400 [Acidobacteriota bacterium]